MRDGGHLQPRTAGEYLAFYLAHEASDLVWYSFVGIIVVLGATALNLTVLVMVCGALVAVLGGWFIYTGVGFVRGTVGDAQPAQGAVCDCEHDDAQSTTIENQAGVDHGGGSHRD